MTGVTALGRPRVDLPLGELTALAGEAFFPRAALPFDDAGLAGDEITFFPRVALPFCGEGLGEPSLGDAGTTFLALAFVAKGFGEGATAFGEEISAIFPLVVLPFFNDLGEAGLGDATLGED